MRWLLALVLCAGCEVTRAAPPVAELLRSHELLVRACDAHYEPACIALK